MPFIFFFFSAKSAAPIDVMEMFPDLFGCVFKFAKNQGWNSETPVKEMFRKEDISISFSMLAATLEENPGFPIKSLSLNLSLCNRG